MKPWIALLLLFSLAFPPPFAQLDLKEKAQLVGLQVEEKQGASAEEKITDISFIFVDKPSTYNHSQEGSLLTLEFYDATLGDEPLEKIEGGPFSDTKISAEKVDVNKIEGMSPELKDVVRVEFTLKEGVQMDYTATDDFNVITVSTAWTLGGKLVTKQTAKKSRLWVWVVGGVVRLTACGVAALLLRPEAGDTTTPPDEGWDPPLPTLPQTP